MYTKQKTFNKTEINNNKKIYIIEKKIQRFKINKIKIMVEKKINKY